MASFLPGLGAFGFGVIIGWFVYFTNRYRKSDVQFSDLTALLGVIGGAGVTSLFGSGSAMLFGAYGLGLAVGFFGYFLTLIQLVRASQGVFNWTWFLDGRRKDPVQGESIPSEARPTTASMAMQPTLAERVAVLEERHGRLDAYLSRPMAAAAPAPPARSPLSEAVEQRDRAIAAVVEVLRDLQRRIGNTKDDAERARLRAISEQLTEKHDELVAMRLKDILETEQVKAALVQLGGITSGVADEAKRMKATADAIAAAATVVDQATKLIGFLGALFA